MNYFTEKECTNRSFLFDLAPRLPFSSCSSDLHVSTQPKHNGPPAENQNGQREGQPEHHPARKRAQVDEERRGEVPGRSVAAGAVHLRGVRFRDLPDHPVDPDCVIGGFALRRRNGVRAGPLPCLTPPSHSRTFTTEKKKPQPQPWNQQQHQAKKHKHTQFVKREELFSPLLLLTGVDTVCRCSVSFFRCICFHFPEATRNRMPPVARTYTSLSDPAAFRTTAARDANLV